MRFVLRIVFLSLALPSLALAGPERVRIQGTINALTGHEVVDGSYVLRVDIYDVATGGTPVYSQGNVTTEVSAGAFSVVLTPSVPGTLRSAFAEYPRFVEITVVSDPNGTPIGQTLFPRQEITSVPFAMSSLPVGAIILWIDGPTCPDGFAEVEAFRNILVRGADSAGEHADVPDTSGETCPGGAGCGAAPERYDDVLQVDELAAHTHEMILRDGYSGESEGPGARYSDYPATAVTDEAGGDQPHYHPFATVLFCEKQP